MKTNSSTQGRLSEAPELDILQTAADLASEASKAVSPGKSLGALIRWRYGQYPESVQAQLRQRGLAELAGMQAKPVEAPATARLSGSWLTVEQVASITGVKPATVKRRLQTVEGRRSYGWPWWDGYKWLIPSPAVDPAMRAEYMSQLPQQEPHAPPTFCEEEC